MKYFKLCMCNIVIVSSRRKIEETDITLYLMLSKKNHKMVFSLTHLYDIK